MRDVHGTFKDYFDSYRVRWEGIDTHEGSMPRIEGIEMVAPEATSFTVTREWLEKLRMDAGAGSTSEVRDKVLAAVNEILPPAKKRGFPLDVLADMATENNYTEAVEDAYLLAGRVVDALKANGYLIVEGKDGD